MTRARALGAAVVGGTLVGFGLLRGRVRRFEISEDSMAPALETGDYVIGTRLDTAPLRGDILVIPHPERPDFLMVKRVLGLPSETVTVSHGQVTINGHILAEPWARGEAAGKHEWKTDPHEIIVMSDNRTLPTEDSRELGPIRIEGLWRLAFRYWPILRAGGV